MIGLTGVLIVAAGTAAYRILAPNHNLLEQQSVRVADLWSPNAEDIDEPSDYD